MKTEEQSGYDSAFGVVLPFIYEILPLLVPHLISGL